MHPVIDRCGDPMLHCSADVPAMMDNTLPRCNLRQNAAPQRRAAQQGGCSGLLYLIGVPIPLILLLAFCTHHL